MIDAAGCRVNERMHLIGQHIESSYFLRPTDRPFLVRSFWLVAAGPMDRPFHPQRVNKNMLNILLLSRWLNIVLGVCTICHIPDKISMMSVVYIIYSYTGYT